MAFRFFTSNLKSTQRSHLSRIITLQSLLNKTKSINVPPMGSPSSGSSSVTSADDVLPNTHFMIWKRGHVGHSHNHDHSDHHNSSSGNEGERIFRLGLAADISLAAGKAITGYLTGSTAIIADAAHSLSDVVLSGVALWSFKAAMAPKDKEHPYGHGKFETLGALGISGVLLVTSGGIAWHAMDVLVGLWSAAPEMAMAHEHVHEAGGHAHGIDMNHPVLALNMTIVSIAVKEWLYWITKRTGERVGSGLMKANAWHHRADAISSIVALIGVGGSILGVRFLDPLAGLVVSGMICKAGIESGYQSVLELVDAAIPSQQLEPYRQTILQVDGVKGCNHLRGRRAGSFLYLDVNVEVDPFLSVSAAHGIAENVRRKIQMTHPEIAEVFIHIEPSTSHIPAITGQTEDEGNTERRSEENPDVDLQVTDIEDLVSIVLSERFREKMHVERVTRHVLQGKILLEIEVSMPINMSIRDAVTVAEEAEKEIKGAVSNILGVSIQLRLTGAMIELNNRH